MNIVIKIIKILKKANVISFIFSGLFFMIIIPMIFSFIIPEDSYMNPVIESMKEDGLSILFLFGVVLAPFFETLIFQFLPYVFVNAFLKRKIKFYFYIVSASLFFGVMHFYNLYYFLVGTSVGVVLSFYFYVSKLRGASGVMLVYAIHAINNLLALLISIKW